MTKRHFDTPLRRRKSVVFESKSPEIFIEPAAIAKDEGRKSQRDKLRDALELKQSSKFSDPQMKQILQS